MNEEEREGTHQAQEIHKRGAEAINRHDLDAFANLYSTNAVVIDPTYPEPLKGRDAIRKDVADLFGAFPDVQVQLSNSMIGAGVLAAEWKMTGTHRGPLPVPTGTVPATNKRFELVIATFERLDGNGQIVEERRYYDISGWLGQLGIAP
jgi:steroid delta-isomerase-like uncharacterized protein